MSLREKQQLPEEADPPDAVLVRRSRAGDRTAAVALYERYVREIYGFVFHQLGHREDADDVTSEIFLRMVRGLDTFRGQSSFRTWVYAIARNQLRDHWRHNGRQRSVPLEPSMSLSHSHEASPGARAEVTELGQAVLAQLPANYRRVVELRVMTDLSVRETAAAMGTTEGNVKVMLHRALQRASAIAEQIGESP